jgi:hypothetical protein
MRTFFFRHPPASAARPGDPAAPKATCSAPIPTAYVRDRVAASRRPSVRATARRCVPGLRRGDAACRRMTKGRLLLLVGTLRKRRPGGALRVLSGAAVPQDLGCGLSRLAARLLILSHVASPCGCNHQTTDIPSLFPSSSSSERSETGGPSGAEGDLISPDPDRPCPRQGRARAPRRRMTKTGMDVSRWAV